MHFERIAGNRRPIGLTSLIDVVFILLFFFMLTTSFVRTESMELTFPRSAEVKEKVAAAGG
ncbi:MAG: biopolymer transporter ExbD, partial [Alphaproteobacteria bacterium]|nr:biopolymer transporter ExbD [Alphaproteobacteria bacterium]